MADKSQVVSPDPTEKTEAANGVLPSPGTVFGPFRIDFAQTIRKVEGDDDKTFTFNVGTQF